MPIPVPLPPQPTYCDVIDVHREPTSAGDPCQVHLLLEYTNTDEPIPNDRRRITINPGVLRDYGFFNPQETFEALWNLIPDTPQSVKDTISGQIPEEMARDCWLGYKIEE